MKHKTIIWIIVLFLTINLVLAVGIRPAKKTLIFEEGLDYQEKLWVVNNDGLEFTVSVDVEGEMAEYITLKTKQLSFRGDDDAKLIEYGVNLPDSVPPGTSTANVIVTQDLGESTGITGNVISSRIVLKHRIIVQGPYPDKYITAKLNFFENGDKIRIVSEVENLGKTDIGSIQTKFYVNDKQQKEQVLETEETNLKRKENKLLDAQIDKDLFVQGEFEVSAVTTFDDQKAEVVKNLRVGKPEIEITYFDKFFIANKINQYSLDLLNKWNKKIKNVFVDVEVKKDDLKIDEFRTKSIDIDGLMLEKIQDYFDAKEKNPGTYTFEMEVNFWNNYDIETKSFSAELITEEEFNNLPTGASIVGSATGNFGTASMLLLVVFISVLVSGGAFYLLWRQKNKSGMIAARPEWKRPKMKGKIK